MADSAWHELTSLVYYVHLFCLICCILVIPYVLVNLSFIICSLSSHFQSDGIWPSIINSVCTEFWSDHQQAQWFLCILQYDDDGDKHDDIHSRLKTTLSTNPSHLNTSTLDCLHDHGTGPDLFLVRFSFNFTVCPVWCGGLSWLHVSFILHVKYTVLYHSISFFFAAILHWIRLRGVNQSTTSWFCVQHHTCGSFVLFVAVRCWCPRCIASTAACILPATCILVSESLCVALNV